MSERTVSPEGGRAPKTPAADDSSDNRFGSVTDGRITVRHPSVADSAGDYLSLYPVCADRGTFQRCDRDCIYKETEEFCMSIILSLFNLLILLSVVLIVPILIGVYVYRDATRRGMNAVMWTLIALLAPSMIGLIIYLLVRSSYSDMECPRCGTTVKEEYVLCPKCGAELRPFCPNCSAPVEPDWTVCPRCASPLEEIGQDVVVPTRKKDKSLGVILLAVILIPVVLILVMVGVFAFQMTGTNGSGSTSISAVYADDYIAEIKNDEISAWYQNCTDDRAHILYYEAQDESGEPTQVRFLIRMPELRDPITINFDNNAGFIHNKLEIRYGSYGNSTDEYLILVTCTGDDINKEIILYCDNEVMDYEIEGTDTVIALPDNAELIAAEQYSSGGRNGAVYVRPEEVPAAQAGE